MGISCFLHYRNVIGQSVSGSDSICTSLSSLGIMTFQRSNLIFCRSSQGAEANADSVAVTGVFADGIPPVKKQLKGSILARILEQPILFHFCSSKDNGGDLKTGHTKRYQRERAGAPREHPAERRSAQSHTSKLSRQRAAPKR